MAIISRRQYDHPALATAGGSGLHASITNLYTLLGDDSMSRYKAFTAVANSSVGVIAHEFGLDFANLKVQIFTGTYPALTLVADPIGSGWTVAATSGLASRSIDVTAPASGGPHTYAVLVSHESNATQFIPGLVSIAAQTFAGSKTFLNPILSSLGLVGTPGYSFAGDTDTGMWSSAANTLSFSTAGIKALELSSTAAATFGDVSSTPRLNGFHTTYKNIFGNGQTGTTDLSGAFIIGANTFQTASNQPTRIDTLSGAALGFFPRGTANLSAFVIYGAAISSGATTTAATIASATAEGVWSWGVSGTPANTAKHSIEGSIFFGTTATFSSSSYRWLGSDSGGFLIGISTDAGPYMYSGAYYNGSVLIAKAANKAGTEFAPLSGTGETSQAFVWNKKNVTSSTNYTHSAGDTFGINTRLGQVLYNGVWEWGPTALFSATKHTLNGAVVGYGNSTQASFAGADAITLTANLYRSSAGLKGVQAGTGYTLVNVIRSTTAGGTVFAISSNYQDAQTVDGTALTTNDRTIMSATAAGELTLGSTAVSHDHLMQSGGLTRLILNSATGNNTSLKLNKNSVQQWEIYNAQSATDRFSIDNAVGTAVLTGTQAGAWTLNQIHNIGAGNITSGSYTPVLTNGSNLQNTPAPNANTFYSRVGNVVTVSGRCDVDIFAASNTSSRLEVTLPIAANHTGQTNYVQGVITVEAASGTAMSAGNCISDQGNPAKCSMLWNASTSGVTTLHFIFQYYVV